MKMHTDHLVDCSADELWDLTFTADFDLASNLEANGMRLHQTLSIDRLPEAATWTLRSRSTPATGMPRFVQQWVDREVHYDTELTHAPGSHIGEAELKVSLGGEYVTMKYRMATVPVTPTSCRRIFDWEVTVYGVGSLVERFILGEIRRGVDRSAQFVNDWVARRRGRAAKVAVSANLDRSVQNRIERPAAEINLTEHCNLKCAGCNHASHLLPKKFVALADVERDLAALAPVMLLDELKLVGGEPLLHPELVAILRAARASGIARQLTLVTNGVLLHKVPDEVFWLIDRLWVSRYPGVKVQFDLPSLEARCKANEVTLWHKETNEFSLSLINRRIDEEHDAVVREVYAQCGYAHVWSCHTIYEGRYYKCSPAPFVPKRLALLGNEKSEEVPSDYVDLLAGGDLRARLEAYLASAEPLSACRRCLGHLGRDQASQQLNRAGLKAELAADHGDLIALFHPDRRPRALGE